MQRTELAAGLGVLAIATGRALDPETVEAYWLGLQDLDAGEFSQACQTALRTSKWFPRIAELRQMAGRLTPADRAIVAWGIASAAVASVGPYRSVCFSDPITNAVVRRMGGWVNFYPEGTTTREWESFYRQRFIETYVATCRVGVGVEDLGRLPGIHESSWLAGGHAEMIKANPPEMIACGLPPVEPEMLRLEGPHRGVALASEVAKIGVMADEETENPGG